MAVEGSWGDRVLVVEVQACICAFPLSRVIETFRPVPVEPVPGLISYVRGISIIRGTPVPVVDLGDLLNRPGGVAGRFVTLRVADRQIALAVGRVLGVAEPDALTLVKLPSLLDDMAKDVIEAIGTLDSQLLVVLRNGWRLPEEVWHKLETREKAE